LLATARASAWQGAHETGSTAGIHVGPDGVASVEQKISVSVTRGPLRSIEIVSLEAGQGILDPIVPVTAEDGRVLSARVAPPDAKHDRSHLKIEVDDPRLFPRGAYVFAVHYQIDWVASGALTSDGALWRLTWSSPVAADGFDSATTTIDFPAAPEAPRPILPETGAVDDSVVASLQRDAARDLLTLVRPHLGPGDSVTWTVRVDPRALPAVVDPRLRPPVRWRAAAAEPDRVRGVSLAIALGALALAFGLLVRHKGRVFAAACAERGVAIRALIALPEAARASLAGCAFAAGVWLEVTGRFAQSAFSAALIALAILAATLRGCAGDPPARGAGRWLALRPEDAFARPRSEGHWLDAGTCTGQLFALAVAAAVALLAFAVRAISARGPWIVLLDAAPLIPIWATGSATCLPPAREGRAAPWLERAFERLREV
ncbi:MAG: hypothetical protein ACREJ3_17025, partial [Polyangiaceae bacterium]